MKANVSEKLGTGQCDGWKSGAKASIITTCVLDLEVVMLPDQLYMIAAHDLSPERKTADNLLEIVLEDLKYCEEQLGIIFIAFWAEG
ncbi:hypothetical protein B0H13DRAFT_1587241 [Mycena leptocephala]|nr:hypothetical protein B0H13DRAFT_1587241 [Mycena leptocephala]